MSIESFSDIANSIGKLFDNGTALYTDIFERKTAEDITMNESVASVTAHPPVVRVSDKTVSDESKIPTIALTAGAVLLAVLVLKKLG